MGCDAFAATLTIELHAGGVPDISRWQAPQARSHRSTGPPDFCTPEGCRRTVRDPGGVGGWGAILIRWLRAFGACHRLMSDTPPAWRGRYIAPSCCNPPTLVNRSDW